MGSLTPRDRKGHIIQVRREIEKKSENKMDETRSRAQYTDFSKPRSLLKIKKKKFKVLIMSTKKTKLID